MTTSLIRTTSLKGCGVDLSVDGDRTVLRCRACGGLGTWRKGDEVRTVVPAEEALTGRTWVRHTLVVDVSPTVSPTSPTS